MTLSNKMAEREGFEPSVELVTLQTLSRRPPSADSAISPVIYFIYLPCKFNTLLEAVLCPIISIMVLRANPSIPSHDPKVCLGS